METTAQALQSEDPFQKNKRWAIYFLSLLIFTYIESPVFIFVISRIYIYIYIYSSISSNSNSLASASLSNAA